MIDLIIQGPQDNYGAEIINHYRDIPWVNKIIVSCWKDDSIKVLEDDQVKIIQSIPPKNNGIGNRNYHIVSSFNGLQYAETSFVAKLRSDQKISLDSMNVLYERMMQNPDKIGTLGFYKPFPFHPRDHSFWGRKEKLQELFDIPLDEAWHYQSNPVDSWPHQGFYSYQTRAECYIASQYLAKKDSRVKEMVNNPQTYLWDFSEKWDAAIKLSEELLPQYFYPMPRIDFEWPKHGLSSYPYESVAKSYGEYWGI